LTERRKAVAFAALKISNAFLLKGKKMIRTLSLAAVIASMFSFPGASPAESAENFAKHAQQTIPIKTITSKKIGIPHFY